MRYNTKTLAKKFLSKGHSLAVLVLRFLKNLIPSSRVFRIIYTLVLVILFSGVLTTISYIIKDKSYNLSEPILSIIDSSSVDKQLIKDEQDTITYNRADEDSPKELQQVLSAAASKQDSTGDKPYQATLHKDTKKGITFSDNTGDKSFTLTPRFNTNSPRLDDGRVIYPDGSNEKHIYSFKTNGIKSDIVLNQLPNDITKDNNGTKQYIWDLNLSSDLEAKMLPDGGVGIYGPDLSILNNATAGDDKSKELLDKAKQNAGSTADKSLLVFELPKPFIVSSNKDKNYDDVNYSLDSTNKVLTLTTRNLNNQPYPISIDPTITVTTTSDFNQKTGDTGNIDSSTADEIRRGNIGSGAVGGWTSTTSFTTGRGDHTTVAYNGYLYILGGNDFSSIYNTVQYAPINANGTIGSWTATTSFTTTRNNHTTVAHNGYIYVIGGYNGGVFLNDVQYAPINANGTIGSWTATTSFTTTRNNHTSVAYNGYLYVVGGFRGTYLNDVEYAPINANGTIGSWTATTSFTNSRQGHTSVAYNGYMYIIGGNNLFTDYSDIQYAPINANGTIGSWTATTSFTGVRAEHTSVVSGGYLYVIGGYFNGSGTVYNDVQYAPINANGTTGTWSTSTSFTTARRTQTSVVYNGFLYVAGGRNASNTRYNDVQYTPIGQGRASTWTATTSFTTGRNNHTSVAYNGYLYVMGGVGSGGFYLSDVQYAPINANGTIGTWTATTSFTTTRGSHTSIAYNGYLYVLGGTNGSNLNTVQYAPINTNGTIGTWTATTSLITARRDHTSVIHGGYLYVIGGSSPSLLDTVQYAPINTNGTIGTWTATTSFNTARNGHTSVTYNGYLYVIGGYDGVTFINDVQYAPINANGTIGTWTATTSYTTGSYEHTSVAHNGYLYIIGGYPGFGIGLDIVQYAPINANGTIGPWTSTTSLINGRERHASVAYNGFLYLVGGSGSVYNDVQYANIGPPTSSGIFVSTTPFNFARNYHTSVAYNGYLYIIGGWDGSTSFNTVQYAPINANGTIGAWTATTNLVAPLFAHTSVAYNGYMYVIGGYFALNSVYYASINANGSIGAWTPATNLTVGRHSFSSIAYNGYLYVTGGVNTTGTVQYAPINSNGSIGNWITTNSLTVARNGHISVVWDGYIYSLGGNVSGIDRNDIEYAPLNADGSVGAWKQQLNAFSGVRYNFGAVAKNNSIYIIGGESGNGGGQLFDMQQCSIANDRSIQNCISSSISPLSNTRGVAVATYNGYIYSTGGRPGGYTNQVGYTPILNTDLKARYERTLDTGSASSNLLTLTLNGTSPCSYTVSYRTAPGAGTYGTTYTLYKVVPGVAQTITGGSTQRYLFVVATLDDSTCGGQSSLTSIDMFYNDPPAPPTLTLPTNGAVNVNVLPEFRLGTTDDVDPFVRYSIEVCTNITCSSILRTIDQTLSQTGWISQSEQSGTAFPGGPILSQFAVHQYQPSALTANTQYWWRARAIDPSGTNAWSAYSPIFSFDTEQSQLTKPQVNIKGNVNIGGDVIIRP